MMKINGMGSNGMMGGSGGMMGGGSGGMMLIHEKNCPSMGTMTDNVQSMMTNMQAMRKEHMVLNR